MSDPGLRRQIACTPEEQRPSTAGRVSIPCCFVLRVCAPVSQTHRLVLGRLGCSFSFLSSCRSLLEAVTQPDLYYHYTNMYYGQSSFMFTGVTSGIFLPTEWVVVERRTSIGRDTLMIRRLAAFWICRAVSRIVKKNVAFLLYCHLLYKLFNIGDLSWTRQCGFVGQSCGPTR